jgi:hypothetical protein
MKFRRSFEPERIVGDKNAPEWMQSLYYDRSREMLIATNGYAVCGLPAPPSSGDDTTKVSADAPREWRKREMRTPIIDAPLSEPFDDNYPDVISQLPRFQPGDAGTVSFIINPALLLDLSKAIGTDKRRGTIRVTAMSPGLDGGLILGPMVITGGATGKEIAVIAPCEDRISYVDNPPKRG